MHSYGGGRYTRCPASPYSADWSDFVSRHGRGETLVFLGWLTPLLALAGLGLLVAARRYALAALLALAAILPALFALGTNLPTYSLARRVVPHLKVSRVPERLLPIACLALAALLAFALARAWPLLLPLALLLIAVDLRAQVHVYGALAADRHNAAYAALRTQPSGRLLELPVFAPDILLNSTYLFYDMQAPRERPTGYSTTVRREAHATARALQPLGCGNWADGEVSKLGIRYVAVHRGFFSAFRPRCLRPALAGLRAHGFRPLAADGDVQIFAR